MFSRLISQSKLCIRSAETSPFSTHTSSLQELRVCSSSDVYIDKSATGPVKRTESSPQQQTPEGELCPDTLQHKVPGTKSVVNVEGGDGNMDGGSQVDGNMEGGQADGKVKFCVADVRKRLNDHLHTPKKMFHRDPEDPSGLSH